MAARNAARHCRSELPADAPSVRAPPATARHGSRRKIDIGVDEQTLEIRAIEITGSNVGDAPRLPELLDQLPADVELGSVTADGALRAPPVRG